MASLRAIWESEPSCYYRRWGGEAFGAGWGLASGISTVVTFVALFVTHDSAGFVAAVLPYAFKACLVWAAVSLVLGSYRIWHDDVPDTGGIYAALTEVVRLAHLVMEAPVVSLVDKQEFERRRLEFAQEFRRLETILPAHEWQAISRVQYNANVRYPEPHTDVTGRYWLQVFVVVPKLQELQAAYYLPRASQRSPQRSRRLASPADS